MTTFDPRGSTKPPRLPGDDFNVPFDEAIAWAKERKAMLPEEFYGARLQAVRARSFAIAGLAALNQVQQVADSLAAATADGTTLREWQRNLPDSVFELGSARRELIFRNAVQTHYGIGRTIQQRENAGNRPYLMWDAINDSRTRPTHRAMDNHIAPVDDPIWKTWHPPAGWNCRCSRISLTEAQARARGYPKQAPAVEPDAGWAGDPTEGNEDLVSVIRARRDACLTTFADKRARARGLWCEEGPGETLIARADEAAGGGGDNARVQPPLRRPWSNSEPEVFIVAGESAVKQHPSYALAKAGAADAAWRLASDFLEAAPRDRLALLLSARPILLPVHAVEAAGVNEIPSAMAGWLSRRYGLEWRSGIVQTNLVGHTGASGWHRLAHQALFDGLVEAGASYLLVDDFVGQGGTLSNLRGYLAAHGARVAGMVALTGSPRSSKIALSARTLDDLRKKHGSLEPWWSNEVGFDFARLTQSEAEYLLRVDVDTIRSRMAEARQQSGA